MNRGNINLKTVVVRTLTCGILTKSGFREKEVHAREENILGR